MAFQYDFSIFLPFLAKIIWKVIEAIGTIEYLIFVILFQEP